MTVTLSANRTLLQGVGVLRGQQFTAQLLEIADVSSAVL